MKKPMSDKEYVLTKNMLAKCEFDKSKKRFIIWDDRLSPLFKDGHRSAKKA